MKNILVLAGGGDSDQNVCATALGVAQPLGAHLEFLHIQVDPGEAALWQPHAEFARGPAMREILQRLETECVMRTAVARDNFVQFCELRGISITGRPKPDSGVSASWREEMGEADRRLMFCARHYDLVVLARPTGPNGLPPDLLEWLLLGCGRPLLIASPQRSDPLLGTVMVCPLSAPRSGGAITRRACASRHGTLASLLAKTGSHRTRCWRKPDRTAGPAWGGNGSRPLRLVLNEAASPRDPANVILISSSGRSFP
jgi:hypothetical protein